MARGTPTPATTPLGLKEKMDSQGHSSFCYCPTWVYKQQQQIKDGWPGVHQLLLPPHLGFYKGKDGQPGAHQLLPLSHMGVSKKKRRKRNNQEKRWMARGTPIPATNALRLKRKGGQPRAYQLWLQPQVGEPKRWLKGKDGQSRAHQLWLLSQVSVKKNKNMSGQGYTNSCYHPNWAY